MKRLYCVILAFTTLFISGCQPKTYQLDEQQKTAVTVSQNAYMLAGKKLKTIAKSEYEKEKVVYYVENEEDLVQVLQYTIDKKKTKVAYQSDAEINLDVVTSYLSYLNPFDISLTLSTTDYKNQSDKLMYRSNIIEIQNPNERYEQAYAVAKRIYKEIIRKGMSNDEKIQAIHDYLVKSIIYDEEAAYDNNKQSAVFKVAGALVDKKAVCSGYSRAFMMLAKLADVPAIYVASDTMNHGWNLVYGDFGWRFIDVTWDDPMPDQFENVEHRFLAMSIAEFKAEGSHVFDTDKNADFYLTLAKTIFNKNE